MGSVASFGSELVEVAVSDDWTMDFLNSIPPHIKKIHCPSITQNFAQDASLILYIARNPPIEVIQVKTRALQKADWHLQYNTHLRKLGKATSQINIKRAMTLVELATPSISADTCKMSHVKGNSPKQ